MTGADRPGLFSEISAALGDLHCNVVEAHAWSHNAHLACVAYISDESTRSPIQDPNRLASIQDHLTTVLRATTEANSQGKEARTKGFLRGYQGSMTNVERRLHQLMLSVRDFDEESEEGRKTAVWIESCQEKGYSMVSIECKDRRRLMFDTVCTLTDMHYVIFHASISSHQDYAFQVFYNISISISISIY